MGKHAVIYCRLSVAKDESVSIARQIQSARKYAEARGWTVLEVFKDDGVSATHNKPEDRKGWRALLAYEQHYDAVIVWKVDRLARRVLDFLHADEALQNRGAGLVCVEDPVDMTTAQGRAFATVLAVFGELEAATIRARVKGARDFLLRQGRVVGGTIPYGWMKVPNPEKDGKGFVLAQDPDRIDSVRTMAEMVLADHTLYSVQQWATENAPLPKAAQKTRKSEAWAYSTVERLMRNPILSGMTAYNPGNQSKQRGDEVLRDETGLPVIDESIAILTTDERRTLLAKLDGRDSPQAQPRASKAKTSPLLSRLVTCGHCDKRMQRGTTQGRPSLSCPACHQTVSHLDRHVSERLLEERGNRPMFEFQSAGEPDPANLGDIEEAIQRTAAEMTQDGADVVALAERLTALKETRAEARNATTPTVYRLTGQTVAEAWEAAENDDLARRRILASQAKAIVVKKGKVGRAFDASRLAIEWHSQDLTLPDGTVLPSLQDGTKGAEQVAGTWFVADGSIYYTAAESL